MATQYAPAPCKVISSHVFARWHLFRHVGYLRHQQQVDLWPFDLESGIRVACDVGYLCANFSLPRPLCSRVRPNVHDRQTDVRCQTKASLNASAPYGGGGIIICYIPFLFYISLPELWLSDLFEDFAPNKYAICRVLLSSSMVAVNNPRCLAFVHWYAADHRSDKLPFVVL